MKAKMDILEWIRSTGRDPMFVSIEALRLLQELADHLYQSQPAVSEDDIITEIMNNGMAGVFDEDGVVLCYDVNANMAAKAIMELLNKPTKK